MKKNYFHFFVLMLAMLLLPSLASAVTVKVDRSKWTISACNTCPTGYEGTDENGNISAAIDNSTTSFYHSDWSGQSSTAGNSGLQAFLIDMTEDVSNLVGFDYAARYNSDSGHAYTCRVYIYADGQLPSDVSDLASLTSSNKETILASTNANLGTPAFNNSGAAWTYSANTDVQTGSFASTTGRYILFIQDSGKDAWLTCADFNMYQESASITYTVNITTNGAEGTGVKINGTSYSDKGTFTSTTEVTSTAVVTTAVSGYYTNVVVDGADINVSYYKEYCKSGQAYLIKNVASGAFVNTATLVSSNISIQNEGTPLYFTANSGSWFINDAADNSGNYIYTDGAWNCKTSSTATAWTIVETDTEGQYRLQSSTGYLAPDAAAAGQALWTDKAATNQYGIFEIVTYDISAYEDALSSVIEAAREMIGKNPGEYNSTKANAAITTAETALTAESRTITTLSDAKVTLETALQAAINLPRDGKVYVIVSAYGQYLTNQGVEKAAYDNNGTASWKTLDNADTSMFWYIIPNDTAYSIQNYSTDKYLTNYNTTGDTDTPWYLKSLGSKQFGISLDKTLPGGQVYLHTGGHQSGDGVSGNLTNWSTGVGGASSWYIRMVSDPALSIAKGALQNKVDTLNSYIYGENPGYYPASDSTAVKAAVATAQEVLDGGSSTAITYTNALTALNEATKNVAMIQITSGNKYFIINGKTAFNKTKALSSHVLNAWTGGTNEPGWEEYSINNPEEIWTLTADGTGFKMYNTWASKYIATAGSLTADAEEAKTANFEYVGNGQFTITLAGQTNPLHANLHSYTTSANVVEYGGGAGSPSAWYIVNTTAAQEAIAADTLLATVQGVEPIALTAGATVIAPTEFAAPAEVNAAIAAVDGVSTSATVATKGASFIENETIINNYRNAINNYGGLMSIDYTSVKGWNTIILPVNWSCPDDWYRFSCAGLQGTGDTLSVVASSGTKNTPMLVYANSAAKYQFIGYKNGANDSLNVSNGWLTGILVAADNKTVIDDATTTYIISEANQTITKVTAATTVALYHCYINADSVLTYTTLHFPGCNTTRLQSALATADTYKTYIGTGLGKYTDTTGSFEAAVAEGTALSTATDYSMQVQIDTAVVHLNTALNGLTINQPEVGKYYRIKETKGGTYFSSRNSDSYIVKESAKSANNIFYLDTDNKLLSYARGLYMTTGVLNDNIGNGCSAVTLADADAENFTVQFLKANELGSYVLRNSKNNSNFYHWEWNANNVIAMTNGLGDARTYVTLEEVDSLPLSLTQIGDNTYSTLYLPVAVKLCGDSVVAYTPTVVDSAFTLNAIADGIIPARTGVILRGTTTSGVAAVTTTANTVDSELTGTIYSTNQKNAENNNAYVLGSKSGALNFYRLNESIALTGGRAYYDPANGADVTAYTLSFEDNATSIQNVEVTSVNNAIYDLSGRQVQKAQKGIYIQNGKKFIVK